MSKQSNTQTEQASSLSQRLFITLQYLLPQLMLTRLVGWFCARTTPWIKNASIRMLVKGFSINAGEAEKSVPDDYTSLNDFFTRRLKADARVIDSDPAAILSPCDGTISQCGEITDGTLLQAKGHRFSVAGLLQDDAWAKQFHGGQFITIYLAPYDYHRVHVPVSATLTKQVQVPGALFSVNQATAAAVKNLFSRNERRVFQFASEHAEFAQVMVGALNVGSISTVWGGHHPAGLSTKVAELSLPKTPTFNAGDTLGWFNMGSTVILVFPKDTFKLDATLAAGTILRMGERIGTVADSSN